MAIAAVTNAPRATVKVVRRFMHHSLNSNPKSHTMAFSSPLFCVNPVPQFNGKGAKSIPLSSNSE